MALSVDDVKEDDLRIMEEQSGNFSQVEEKEARAPDSQENMGLTLASVKDDLRIRPDQSGDDAKLGKVDRGCRGTGPTRSARRSHGSKGSCGNFVSLVFVPLRGASRRGQSPFGVAKIRRCFNREALAKDPGRTHPGGDELIMRWPWSNREKRQASYSEAVSSALLSVASGVGNFSQTGAVEMAASTVGKALALSSVSPSDNRTVGPNSILACKYWAAVGHFEARPFSLSRSGAVLSD